MKYLIKLLIILVISNSILFSQENQKKVNPYPEFIPYITEQTVQQKNVKELDFKELGKEQPTRWLSVDPMADKYPGWSPYNYAANNPLLYVDLNGDSIQVSGLQPKQQASIIADLVSLTGMPLYINGAGKLVETPKFTYNDKTFQLASAYGSASGNTSKTAANFLSHAISSSTIVNVISTSVRGSQAGGQLMKMNSGQIDQFIKGTPSPLDSRTMGYGITFLHELTHTNLGQSFYNSSSFLTDLDGSTMGQVVPKMNVIRGELGTGFGQRTQYAAQPGIGNSLYIPFGSKKITFRKTWR